MKNSGYPDFRLTMRLLQYARPYWKHITGIALLTLIATPLALLAPLPLKIAIDSVIGDAPLPGVLQQFFVSISRNALLLWVAIFQVVVILLIQLRELLVHVLSSYAGEKLTLDFRSRLIRHVQRLSFSFHDTRGTADSIYRIQWDAPAIQWILIYGILPLFSVVLTLFCMVAVTASLDWQLAAVALSVTPFLVIATQSYKTRMRGRYLDAKDLESGALHVIQETLSGARVVKSFGRENAEEERFIRKSTEGTRARVQLAIAEGSLGLLINFLTAAGTAGVIYAGALAVLGGGLTIGELVLVMAYLAQLYAPIQTISSKFGMLQACWASASRTFELLDQIPDVTDSPHGKALKKADGNIEFQDVNFSYERNRPALQEISFSIAAKTRLGIAGRTGAGKTTILSLLTRFYDPTSGVVKLDGMDIRDYKLADLRNQFGIVLQEPVLFSTSIAENIAYGRPEVDFHEIVEAAQAASAHEFIERLPGGYDTIVGERGASLFGRRTPEDLSCPRFFERCSNPFDGRTYKFRGP